MQVDAVQHMAKALKDGGLIVYQPGEHPNECKAPYIVIRQMGTYPTVESSRTGYTLATVNVYVPLKAYEQLLTTAEKTKRLLTPLHAQARPTGNETPDMIEEDYRAHTRAIEYQIMKKLRSD